MFENLCLPNPQRLKCYSVITCLTLPEKLWLNSDFKGCSLMFMATRHDEALRITGGILINKGSGRWQSQFTHRTYFQFFEGLAMTNSHHLLIIKRKAWQMSFFRLLFCATTSGNASCQCLLSSHCKPITLLFWQSIGSVNLICFSHHRKIVDSFAVYAHVMLCLSIMLLSMQYLCHLQFFNNTHLDMFAQGEEGIKFTNLIIPQPLKPYNLILSGCSLNCVLAFAANFISGC